MLRNGTEFCILRGLLYDGTVSEQKAENAQKPCNFVEIARLLNCFGGRSKTSALQSYETVNFFVHNLSAWFSPLYRQSETASGYPLAVLVMCVFRKSDVNCDCV